jgi:hypothetical protein
MWDDFATDQLPTITPRLRILPETVQTQRTRSSGNATVATGWLRRALNSFPLDSLPALRTRNHEGYFKRLPYTERSPPLTHFLTTELCKPFCLAKSGDFDVGTRGREEDSGVRNAEM